RVPVDSYGVALWRPIERDVLPSDCARCSLVPVCRQLPTQTGVAMLWRRLGLVDTVGVPTLRGRIVSFFSQGYGLAIAAGLEDKSYPLDERGCDGQTIPLRKETHDSDRKSTRLNSSH